MTIQELQNQINSNNRATRSDIQEVLNIYNDPENTIVNITEFLSGCTISETEKIKILQDINSYVK